MDLEIDKKSFTVCQLAGFAAPYGGNFLASLLALEKACTEKNIRLLFIFSEEARLKNWCLKLIASGRDVYFLPTNVGLIQQAFTLLKIIKTKGVRIIHTHFSQYDVTAWLTGMVLRFYGKKVLVIWHHHSDFPQKNTILRPIKRFIKHHCIGRSVFIITVSEHLKQREIGWGMSSQRITTINNGIDFNRAITTSRSKSQVLSNLNIPKGRLFILMFGWNPPIKGVDVALNALIKVNAIRPEVILGIVGTDELRNYVQSFFNGKLPEWICLMPPTEMPADYYQCASIFVSASRSEGFPYALCEAIINGCFVISSDIPGTNWAQSLPGFQFFPVGNFDSLSKTILKVISQTEEERFRLIDNARQAILKEYDIARWCRRILEFYSGLIQ